MSLDDLIKLSRAKTGPKAGAAKPAARPAAAAQAKGASARVSPPRTRARLRAPASCMGPLGACGAAGEACRAGGSRGRAAPRPCTCPRALPLMPSCAARSSPASSPASGPAAPDACGRGQEAPGGVRRVWVGPRSCWPTRLSSFQLAPPWPTLLQVAAPRMAIQPAARARPAAAVARPVAQTTPRTGRCVCAPLLVPVPSASPIGHFWMPTLLCGHWLPRAANRALRWRASLLRQRARARAWAPRALARRPCPASAQPLLPHTPRRAHAHTPTPPPLTPLPRAAQHRRAEAAHGQPRRHARPRGQAAAGAGAAAAVGAAAQAAGERVRVFVRACVHVFVRACVGPVCAPGCLPQAAPHRPRPTCVCAACGGCRPRA